MFMCLRVYMSWSRSYNRVVNPKTGGPQVSKAERKKCFDDLKQATLNGHPRLKIEGLEDVDLAESMDGLMRRYVCFVALF